MHSDVRTEVNVADDAVGVVLAAFGSVGICYRYPETEEAYTTVVKELLYHAIVKTF